MNFFFIVSKGLSIAKLWNCPKREPLIGCLQQWTFKHFMSSWPIGWEEDVVLGGKNIKLTL